jgi:hypothetical protein
MRSKAIRYPQNDALSSLAPIIGDWSTEGTHGFLPGITLRGTTSFKWHESGAFIIVHTYLDDSRIPPGIQIFGSDDELDNCTMIYYDVRGVSRNFQASIDNGGLKWWRDADAPGFSQRYILTFPDDGQTMIGKGEICKDGSTWEKDLDLTYTRINT